MCPLELSTDMSLAELPRSRTAWTYRLFRFGCLLLHGLLEIAGVGGRVDEPQCVEQRAVFSVSATGSVPAEHADVGVGNVILAGLGVAARVAGTRVGGRACHDR